jgi:hypothetical protein
MKLSDAQSVVVECADAYLSELSVSWVHQRMSARERRVLLQHAKG